MLAAWLLQTTPISCLLVSSDFMCYIQATSKPWPFSNQDAYEEVKTFFTPVNPFERDFLIVPVHFPGHWALSVVCRPLALVRKLLGSMEVQAQSGSEGDMQARVPPCIVFADSMGSKGLRFRKALAYVLVQHYMESHCRGTQAQMIPDEELGEALGPEVSTPLQNDIFSCGDNVLHATRRFASDVIRPALLHRAGAAGDSGESTPICIENIMTIDWFTCDDAKAERENIKRSVLGLPNQPQPPPVVLHTVDGCGGQVSKDDSSWDVYCDTVATDKEQLERERKLTADVMQHLAHFQVQPEVRTANTLGPTTQQVRCFSSLHCNSHTEKP